jgi:4-amino-4-deoxy-L-arabinose transferase-like glycosyltransferase
MLDASRRRASVAALALVAATSVLHVWWSGQLQLSAAEAWAWQASRGLAPLDQPPLGPWTIRLTTALLGTTERTVRIAGTLHAAVAAAFFFLAGRRLLGARPALAALLAALAMPLYSLGAAVAGPGAPLVAGACAALYATVRALEEHGAWLVAAGAAAAWATLGHEAGLLLVPQIALALAIDRRGRALLRGAWPWLGVAIATAAAVAIDVPAPAVPAATSALDRTMRFLGIQALLVTPILGGVVWVAAVAAALRRHDAAMRALAVFALPPLLLALALAPFAAVPAALPAIGYPAALLAAAGFLAERPRERRGLAAVALATALPASVYLHLAATSPALPLPARQVPTVGWKELAARVDAERRRIGDGAFVVGCGPGVASALAFYLPDRPVTHASIDEAGAALDGRTGIVVSDRRERGRCGEREERCAPLQRLRSLVARRRGRPVTTFELWRCRYRAEEPRDRARQ